jgi:hypothetical protein
LLPTITSNLFRDHNNAPDIVTNHIGTAATQHCDVSRQRITIAVAPCCACCCPLAPWNPSCSQHCCRCSCQDWNLPNYQHCASKSCADHCANVASNQCPSIVKP